MKKDTHIKWLCNNCEQSFFESYNKENEKTKLIPICPHCGHCENELYLAWKISVPEEITLEEAIDIHKKEFDLQRKKNLESIKDIGW